MTDERTPLLVGAAQFVQREAEPLEALEPLAMLEHVARAAARDAGAGERALAALDTIGVVDVVAWRPKNAPGLLGEALGARPARQYLSAIGGEIPLVLVGRIAREIEAGTARCALVAGCNGVRTLRRAREQGVELHWADGGSGEPELVGVNRPGSSEHEQQYGLRRPIDVYPIFENALRARRGLDPETHRGRVAALMSRFSQVAAAHPYAWFPTARPPEQIAEPTSDNRMVGYPYTKYMNAVMDNDQAAAVLLMSVAAARAYGIPQDRWVYWWAAEKSAERAWFPSERPDFTQCPALRAAAGGALERAGLTVGDVDHIDLYSCFPAAVEMACDMLGLDEDDPRGLTVTGGLPYFGGPGNNYTLHSLATMMERVRARPGARGLVTGNGWYLTKHSAAVIASAPKQGAARAGDVPELAGAEPVALADRVEGPATVETYTVLYDRDGAPARGIVVGRTREGRRFLANPPDDRELLERFAADEEVGRSGVVRRDDGHNRFHPA